MSSSLKMSFTPSMYAEIKEMMMLMTLDSLEDVKEPHPTLRHFWFWFVSWNAETLVFTSRKNQSLESTLLCFPFFNPFDPSNMSAHPHQGKITTQLRCAPWCDVIVTGIHHINHHMVTCWKSPGWMLHTRNNKSTNWSTDLFPNGQACVLWVSSSVCPLLLHWPGTFRVFLYQMSHSA